MQYTIIVCMLGTPKRGKNPVVLDDGTGFTARDNAVAS